MATKRHKGTGKYNIQQSKLRANYALWSNNQMRQYNPRYTTPDQIIVLICPTKAETRGL